jgi:YHS domain-containing protein
LGGPYENRFRGDPTVYAVIDGKLYFCSSERAKRSFDKRPQEYVKNAELLYLLPELEGACPVTLQKEGTAIRGAEEFKQTYRAKVYFLKDQAALDEFKKDPARYVPQFDGYCAYNASQGSLVAGSQGIFAVVEGRTYFFADLESRARCTADPSKCIPAARANWPKISKDAGKAPGGS